MTALCQSARRTFKGHLRNGTGVTGDCPSGETPAWFAMQAFNKRWTDLEVTENGVVVAAIEPHPETGKRIWWGECV